LGELLRRTNHYAWLAICSAVYVLPAGGDRRGVRPNDGRYMMRGLGALLLVARQRC
jgi:hypothetical protein